MSRPTTRAILLVALAGATLAAPPKRGKPAPSRACVAGEPSFWKDQALTAKVAARLQFHKPLFREKAEVKVSGGAVMLYGNMSSQALIAEAVKTAAAVDGVKCVQNFLQVGPPIASPAQQY
jgi:hypothetical protein